MADLDIKSVIEKLSEMVVLAGPGDLQELAQIHTLLLEVNNWAKENGLGCSATVAENSADLIEKVVLQEVTNPNEALEKISRVVSGFQQVILMNFDEREVQYPEDLVKNKPHTKCAENISELSLPSNVDPDIFQQFLHNQESNLEEIEALLLSFEGGVEQEKVRELKRKIHTLKGEAGVLGLNDVQELCHLAEERIEKGISSELIDTLFALKDWLKCKFDAFAGKGSIPGFPEKLKRALALEEECVQDKSEAGEKKSQEVIFKPKALEGDLELVRDFVHESTEHLENCDIHLLTLETEPENEDSLNAVFRAFHTIKGVSGFLGLEEIKLISHEAENLLDKARKKELLLVGETIDVVFEVVDALKECINNVRKSLATGEPIMPLENTQYLVEKIRSVANKGKSGIAIVRIEGEPKAKLGEILIENGSLTEEGLQRALEIQKLPPQPKKLGEILREENIITSKKLEDSLKLKEEQPGKLIGEVLVEAGFVKEEEVNEALKKQKEPPESPKLGEILVKTGEVEAKEVVQALRAQRAQSLTPMQTAGEAIKVDANRLDQLVDLIGELVIAESMVVREVELRGDIYSELARHVSQLDKITRELQFMAMSLRMIPIKSTFQKMARLVRDLSKKTGKLIEFHMSGEDTELDKTVVDRIGDPLVHMIRNAVDHGIEDTPEERLKKGKPPVGNIYLRAFHSGGNIVIQIEDDGKGLDREAIVKKAIERGLIKSEEGLSDKEIWNLIFEPGFSTAKIVTEVSGRGVGMDVVKKNIESLRGQVEIHSTPGKGTVFTIRLPLTLAIIDGMVVRVGMERYVIPTLSIVISLKPEKQHVHTVANRGEVLSFHGRLINLYKLSNLFEIPGAIEDYSEGTVVVVESGGTQVGILVDEILGQQQIVIKSLGELLKNINGIAGGAIMPDGRVGLILDIAGIIKLAESIPSHV
ncbi:MAG: chemotaxis protein CheA [Candidatus Hydrogenedentes bacterium]|nr:chemotaxis protein CheA [Candidatus Hydrogenedentota bacterium]